MSSDGSAGGVAFATHPELDRNAARSAALCKCAYRPCVHTVKLSSVAEYIRSRSRDSRPAPVSEIHGSWVNSLPARVLTVPAGSSIKRERGQRLLSIRRKSRQPIPETESRFLAALLTRRLNLRREIYWIVQVNMCVCACTLHILI